MTYTDEEIARVVHEANRALQEVHGDECPSLPWACESPDIREITLRGVRLARSGLTPEELHEEWCDAKRAQGWVHGEVKDAGAKPHPTHPCLVPYGELPAHQRHKDMVFLALVKGLSA